MDQSHIIQLAKELPLEAQKALPELETLAFIKDGRNAVFYGNQGTGKTHISIVLGIKACIQGLPSLRRIYRLIDGAKLQRTKY